MKTSSARVHRHYQLPQFLQVLHSAMLLGQRVKRVACALDCVCVWSQLCYLLYVAYVAKRVVCESNCVVYESKQGMCVEGVGGEE